MSHPHHRLHCRPHRRRAWTFSLALALATPALSQDTDDRRRWMSWRFQGENDSLALLSGSDEHYTSGLRFIGLRHPDFTPPAATRFANTWCRLACPGMRGATTNVFGFAITQTIYTPDDLSIPTLIVDDRPYAAWLHGSLLLEILDPARQRWQHSFELQGGLVGPRAGGETLQSELHDLINDEPPLGWDHQLPNEPTLNLVYRYQHRLPARGRLGDHFDLVPHSGFSLGTVAVFANAGFTARAGWNISGFPQAEIVPTVAPPGRIPEEDLPPSDEPPSNERSSSEAPPTTASAGGAERKRREFYFFVGADGRAIAHNIFLDGTVFRDSHSVDKEEFVYDLRAGFAFRLRNFRFTYTFVRRSEEFSPRRGRFDGVHDFGSFTIGVVRTF